MDEGAQKDEEFEMQTDNEDTGGNESSSASKNSEEDDEYWKCEVIQIELNGYQVLCSKDNTQRTKYAKCAIDNAVKNQVW